MEGAPQPSLPIRFGEFEVDLEARELRRNGHRVPLQDQPFRLLALLLERRGKVVTRDELQRKLWPADTFVEFDRSLNTAINKIREALGDSATTPQFVETVPRRGYRFVSPVETVDSATYSTPSVSPAIALLHRISFWKVAVSGLALATVAALLLLAFSRTEKLPDAPLRKFAFTSEEPVESGLLAFGRAVISPDGHKVAYFTGRGSVRKLWVWRLDRDEHKPYVHFFVGGIGPLQKYGYAFWSPDSLFIGFLTASELKKVAVETGAVSTVCLLEGLSRGATRGPDGISIVFEQGLEGRQGLYEVSSRGGIPRLLVQPDVSEKDLAYFTPSFVPSDAGRRLLLLPTGHTITKIMLLNLTNARRTVVASGFWPVYSPTGHVIYQTSQVRNGIWAVPFSLDTMSRTGEPFPVAENGSSPSVSRDGTLVHLEEYPGNKVLTWRSRAGMEPKEIGLPQKQMFLPSLSPDGQRIGVEGIESGTGEDVWIHDARGLVKIRVTVDAARDSRTIWSPDGKEFAFWSDRNGLPEVFVTSASADSSARPLLIDGRPLRGLPNDWSSDGKYLIYSAVPGPRLCYLERNQQGAWQTSVCPPTKPSIMETAARFSPDGRFLAYCSNESGRFETYVRTFPRGDRKWQVSQEGGTQPRWRKDGRELFYVERDTLIALPVSTQPEFSVGVAVRLFSNPALEWEWMHPSYDVSADGRRFVLVEPKGPLRRPAIRVVQNWFAEFRDRK